MNCIRRDPCDYTCPICGELLDEDVDIDWDTIDWDIMGHGHQMGAATCRCGAKMKIIDHFRITETEVEVEE